MPLLTENDRDRVVLEMCHNGAFQGAAEFLETWVLEQMEFELSMQEVKTLTNYAEVDVQFTEAMVDNFIEGNVTIDWDEGPDMLTSLMTAKEIVDKAEAPSIAERMTGEFGKDWGNA